MRSNWKGGTTSLVWLKPALLAYICKSDRPGLSILCNILANGPELRFGYWRNAQSLNLLTVKQLLAVQLKLLKQSGMGQ